jgi:hypothetical protein
MDEQAQDALGPGTVVRRARAVATVALLVWFVTLLGAARAEAVPSVTYECTPAPADCSGWFRSNVSIDWTVLPSGAPTTGCQDKTLTTDTPGTTEICSAEDGAATVTVQLTVKVDMTPPVVTGGRPARPADFGGWYNRAVGISFAGSDLTSGVRSCTSTSYGGPDSAAAAVQGTCTDNAGNVSSPFGYGLRYDDTAPVITAVSPERSPNAHGWFNRAVRFDVEAGDATSGVADCPSVAYAGPDSATASITGRCQDRAGNAASRAFALKYDATAPSATRADRARSPDANGWYNHPVGIAFRGADQLSGIDTCESATYGGPDTSDASVLGTCTDDAGNISEPFSHELRYDASPPAARTARPARPADANGWYNRAVAIEFTGADDTSGVEACTTAEYGGPDGAGVAVSGSCRDRAGNTGGPLAFALSYDETAPRVTGATPERPPDHAGWFVEPVRFDVTGTDAMSGIDQCPAVTYAGPDSASASVGGACTDRAGNRSSRGFPLRYDGTPPALTELTAAGGDRSVRLEWTAGADVDAVEIRRAPGIGEAESVVFGGLDTAFVDRRVENTVLYEYRVTVRDPAGNATARTVAAVPTAPADVPLEPAVADAAPPALPMAGAAPRPPRRFEPARHPVFAVGQPPLLRWRPVRRARYYNLQLLRDGRKILSAWPTHPRYQLKLRWRYRGRQWRLRPGSYRWIVWPGYGPRSRADYGERIVRSTFEVRRSGT